jgi:hypothetical protein
MGGLEGGKASRGRGLQAPSASGTPLALSHPWHGSCTGGLEGGEQTPARFCGKSVKSSGGATPCGISLFPFLGRM